MLLMTQQSTILKTKKKLSEPSLFGGSYWLPVITVLFLITALGKFIAYNGGVGLVKSSFPVFHLGFEDNSESTTKQTYSAEINNHTVAVVVTTKAIFFGGVNAFTSEIANIRNKFAVPHVDGSPQLSTTLKKMEQWITDRKLQRRPIDTDVALLVPHGEVPMPIVIQLLDGINQSRLFGNTVISTGLL